ncbi:MAG: hypothetical protein AAGF85_01510 [Bacteroidota bacterium]
MQKYFESDTATVYYNSELDTIFLEYHKGVKDTTEFILINSELLAAFKALNTQKFVADIRKMGVISIESQNWVVENLIPGMLKKLNGRPLYHAQLIDPEEIFAKVSGTNIKSKAKKEQGGMDVHQFTNQDELEKYLRSI